MKEKSHSSVARHCSDRLGDANWDKMLACRVEHARQRTIRQRRLWLSASLILLVSTISLSVWSYAEAQSHAGMMAMIDEVADPIVGSAFSE